MRDLESVEKHHYTVKPERILCSNLQAMTALCTHHIEETTHLLVAQTVLTSKVGGGKPLLHHGKVIVKHLTSALPIVLVEPPLQRIERIVIADMPVW